MPRGDKSKYTGKQERKADHIAEGYEEKGVSAKEAERRAWATVNKDDGGGKKSGSGRGKEIGHPAARKGGEKGGKASASRTAAERSASARKARPRDGCSTTCSCSPSSMSPRTAGARKAGGGCSRRTPSTRSFTNGASGFTRTST